MTRALRFIGLAFILFAMLTVCSEDVTGPVNNPPVIDSIVTVPAMINPGAELLVKAFASDPDGDSLRYHWSTFYHAGFFYDTAAPACTLLVNKSLDGGMKLMVDLDVSDGTATVSDTLWVPLVSGKKVWGTVYFSGTTIPVPNVELVIKKMVDTSSFRGEFAFNHVTPGENIITLQAGDCLELVDTIEVEDSLEVNYYVNCPELTSTITGHIRANDGTPLSDLEVILLNRDSSFTEIVDTTDADGRYELDNVPIGDRLFAYREVSNPDYDILSDTVSVEVIRPSVQADFSGYIKYSLFKSTALNNPELWNLFDASPYNVWVSDTVNNCYTFNSCIIGGVAELSMIMPIQIPANAVRAGWLCNIDLSNVVCFIQYDINGVQSDGYSFDLNGENITVEELITSTTDPVGSNVIVSFIATGLSGPGCSYAHLNEFEIFYYR